MAEKEGAKVGAEEMEERELGGEEEEVEVKFRLFDGSDIGPVRCNAAATTVAALKDRVVADWPKGPYRFRRLPELCNSYEAVMCRLRKYCDPYC